MRKTCPKCGRPQGSVHLCGNCLLGLTIWFWNWQGGGWNCVGVEQARTKAEALAHAQEIGRGVKLVLLVNEDTLRLVTPAWLQTYEANWASACD